MIRSFRLTESAAANLDRLAADYKISANKVINILLTQAEREYKFLENPLGAAYILEDYFEDLQMRRHISITEE